jgi:hypothetical protein
LLGWLIFGLLGLVGWAVEVGFVELMMLGLVGWMLLGQTRLDVGGKRVGVRG